MGELYLEQYEKIVKGIIPPTYKTPEEQGNRIKKCTILKPVEEIEYSSYSKTNSSSSYR